MSKKSKKARKAAKEKRLQEKRLIKIQKSEQRNQTQAKINTRKEKSVSQLNAIVKKANLNLAPYEILKRKLDPIIYEANIRIERLEASGLESYALDRVYSEKGVANFSLTGLTNYEDIIAEATRARVFLMDKTSTIQGAEDYTQQLSYAQYLGEFGNNYYNFENKYKRYNIQVIDPYFASMAFKAYRMLEEAEQGRIKDFGSDVMIAAMYDMVVKSGSSDTEDSEALNELVAQASDLLDRQIGHKKQQFERAFSRENNVTTLLDRVLVRGKEFYEQYEF